MGTTQRKKHTTTMASKKQATGTKRKRAASSKKKDPHAPKRPLSAYMLFCQEERPKVKEDNPEMRQRKSCQSWERDGRLLEKTTRRSTRRSLRTTRRHTK